MNISTESDLNQLMFIIRNGEGDLARPVVGVMKLILD